MKKKLVALSTGLALLGMAGMAQAALITIGTVTYDDGSGAANYNLIWDDNNNGNSVVWLDYSNSVANWSAQNTWASGLDGVDVLTYNIDSAYSVTWDSEWRLGSTVDGAWDYGYEGDPDGDGNYTYTGGYNLANSEMGHLFYEELGNLGYLDTDGNAQSGYGLQDTGDFDNLVASWYWSGTEYAPSTGNAWRFHMFAGHQYRYRKGLNSYGLALRSGQVSAVPVPGAIWLLGSGLTGLAALGRRKKGNRS